jgi:hypothetical protein
MFFGSDQGGKTATALRSFTPSCQRVEPRLSRIHPANGFLAHEFLAKLTLGINPDEQPRWG